MGSETIEFYRATGRYAFLSNLFPNPIEFEGRSFRCAEEAYQYGKPRDEQTAEWLVSAPRPHLVATAAHALLRWDVRPDWARTKTARMEAVLEAKFAAGTDLASLLVATGSANLVEATTTDAFWGIGKRGDGKNMLGELLMGVRSRRQLHNTIGAARVASGATQG